jgi:DNA invertase Pin-like site-specific DNA recombinase
MTQYIYARTSTKEQNVDTQAELLAGFYPNSTVKTEQASAKSMERPVLTSLLDSLVSGDSLVVYDLTRLNRNTADFLKLLEDLEARSITLIIHNLGGSTIDATSATGKMILTVMASVAQMDREIMLDKQKHGIAAAKKDGKYKGRQVTKEAIAQYEAVTAKMATGMSQRDALLTAVEGKSVSKTSYHRYIKSLKAA